MLKVVLHDMNRNGDDPYEGMVAVKERAEEAIRDEGKMLFAEYVNSLGDLTKEHLLGPEEIDTLDVQESGEAEVDVRLYLAGPFAGG